MLSQSPWVQGNSRRYNAYPLRSRKNVHYPPQPTYIRAPRRGPNPGPIRNPINPHRTSSSQSASSNENKNNDNNSNGNNIIAKKIATPKNTTKSSNLKPNKIQRLDSNRKSLSFVDLSPVSGKPEVNGLRSESTVYLQTRFRGVEFGSNSNLTGSGDLQRIIPLGNVVSSAMNERGGMIKMMGIQPDTNRAASLVCRALVINAWRRRKEDNSELQDTIQHLTQQVDHLRIQIVVLRRLLDTENGRVARFVTELKRVRIQFDDVVKDRDSLRMEKENAIEESKQLREEGEEKKVETENLRNELFTVKTQLVDIDGQISRDREKILKLREEKKSLLEKISIEEALSSTNLSRAEEAEAAIEDLQDRLNSQKSLLSAANKQELDTAKLAILNNEQLIKLKKQLQLSRDAGNSVKFRADDLESKLNDRDAALRRLESAYNSQLSELNDLRDRLSRQSQEGGWSSRVLQIAGSVVRAPRAIFRTLSFLSNSGPAVTS